MCVRTDAVAGGRRAVVMGSPFFLHSPFWTTTRLGIHLRLGASGPGRARDGLLNKYALAGAPPRFFARPPSLFDSHHHLPPPILRQCSLSDPLFNDFNEIAMRECLNLPLERCLGEEERV